MTKEQALALAATKWWESKTPEEIAAFQLQEDLLTMPFGLFHQAVEKALGRPVFTHEFAYGRELLLPELLKERPAPSFDDILALIPKDKQVIVVEAPDGR